MSDLNIKITVEEKSPDLSPEEVHEFRENANYSAPMPVFFFKSYIGNGLGILIYSALIERNGNNKILLACILVTMLISAILFFGGLKLMLGLGTVSIWDKEKEEYIENYTIKAIKLALFFSIICPIIIIGLQIAVIIHYRADFLNNLGIYIVVGIISFISSLIPIMKTTSRLRDERYSGGKNELDY